MTDVGGPQQLVETRSVDRQLLLAGINERLPRAEQSVAGLCERLLSLDDHRVSCLAGPVHVGRVDRVPS